MKITVFDNVLRCFLPVTVVVLLTFSSASRAADHSNLEEGLPVEVADAYPIGYLGREVQGVFEYELDEDGIDKFTSELRLEFGFPRNGQVSVSVPYVTGEVEPDGIGDAGLELFYNINQETLAVPAFAIAGAADFPTADESEGIDPAVHFIATKTLPFSWNMHRVHFNYVYFFNDDVQPGERETRYKVVAGYDTPISTAALFVMDFVREQVEAVNKEINLVEAGIRYQLTPLAVLAAGLGFGVGDDSPDFRSTFGFQYAF